MRPTPKKPRLDIDENQNHQIYNSNLGPAGQENNLKRNLLEDSNEESKIEEISLKELHMRIEDLIDKQLVSNDYLEGVFQVIKGKNFFFYFPYFCSFCFLQTLWKQL